MAFWVYGKDATSGQPAEMLSDAETPEGAQEQARSQGIDVERVEPATPEIAPAEVEHSPEYEFTDQQKAIFSDLASKMRFVGLFLVIGGVLECLTACSGHFGGIISGIVSILLGAWTRSAAGSFQQIVDTQGRDVSHLMSALGDLLNLYWLQYVLLIIALVLLAVVVPIMLLVGH